MSSSPKSSSPPQTPPLSSSAPPQPSSQPSTLNIIMLYMTLLGIGAIGGYGAFHVMFHERCSQIMHETETKHNQSREELRKKYVDALEGQRQCLADNSIKDELHQLQGKLEAQNVLADKHHELLNKQEDTMGQLADANRERDKITKTAVSTREELERVEGNLRDLTKNLHELSVQKIKSETSLNKHVAVLEAQIRALRQETKDLKEESSRCRHWSPIFQRQATQAKQHLTVRSYQLCRLEFGKGPFQVEFTLQFPGSDAADKLVIELFPLEELPHSIYLFLKFVEMKVYDGTGFFGSNRAQIEGGSPDSAAHPTLAARIRERYGKFGFPLDDGVVGVNEYSTSYPHKEFTLGLTGRTHAGPSFFFNMLDNSASKAPVDGAQEPAIGKVTVGHGLLKRIQRIPKKADGYRLEDTVRIQSVRLVQ